MKEINLPISLVLLSLSLDLLKNDCLSRRKINIPLQIENFGQQILGKAIFCQEYLFKV